MSKKRVEAVASSPTNVGPDNDSDKRPRDAIRAFAKRAGNAIVDEFYDAAVKPIPPKSARASRPSPSASAATACAPFD